MPAELYCLDCGRRYYTEGSLEQLNEKRCDCGGLLARLKDWEPIPLHQLANVALLAEVCLRVEAARAYGFVAGGPKIDVRRCEEVLAIAREHGISLSEQEVRSGVRDFVVGYNEGEPVGEHVEPDE
jgi:hypothetical protein